MEKLSSSPVHGNLDGKLKILGFEGQDLIFLMLLASILNLLFGASHFGAVMTFVPSSLLGCVLFFCKRGKPDDYLIHLIRYHTSPGFYSAAAEETIERRGKIDEG